MNCIKFNFIYLFILFCINWHYHILLLFLYFRYLILSILLIILFNFDFINGLSSLSSSSLINKNINNNSKPESICLVKKSNNTNNLNDLGCVCSYYTGCSDCSNACASLGYPWYCCYDNYCCCYSVQEYCNVVAQCPQNCCG